MKELENFVKERDSVNISRTIKASEKYHKMLLDVTRYLDNIYENVTIGQRLWHVRNSTYGVIACKNCNKRPARYIRGRGKNAGYITCSTKCSKEYRVKTREKTCQSKYGVKNTSMLETTKNKIVKTNEERYGHKMAVHNPDIKKKSDKTMMENYGVLNPIHSVELRKKSEETCEEKYGNKHYVASDEGKQSIHGSMISKYGMHHSQTEEFKKKISENNVMKLPKFKKKVIDTHIQNINEFYNGIGYNVKSIKNGKCTMEHNECESTFNIDTKLLSLRRSRDHIICTHCNPLKKPYSAPEKEIIEFISSIYDGTISKNTKEVIPPYEVDIYLPDIKLAIEFNGLYWHSDLVKDRKYHKIKTDMCNSNGIFLMHVWEDDWLHRKDIVKSIIKSRLGLYDITIYARNCEIKEISSITDIRKFLQQNHIQGYTTCSKAYGLFYKGKLVQMMTLKKNGNLSYDLNRLCSMLNTSIIGGASKLFKNFLRDTDVSYVTTFCDIGTFSGKVYESIGMEVGNKTRPIKSYVDQKSIIRIHRRSARKRNKSEMLTIHNSGLVKYFYINDNVKSEKLLQDIKGLCDNNCYTASETYYHLLKTNKNIESYRIYHENVSHWYLKVNGKVVDITADQFNEPPSYEKGVKFPFITKTPSKNCLKVIDRLHSLHK